MTEYGKTPYLTAAQFQEMGYRMVIYPISAMRMLIKAIYGLFTEIRSRGTQKRFLERMFTREEWEARLHKEGSCTTSL